MLPKPIVAEEEADALNATTKVPYFPLNPTIYIIKPIPMKFKHLSCLVALFLCGVAMLSLPGRAASAEELNRDGRRALSSLCINNLKAATVANECTAALVFPTVIKAGFIFGASGGQGVLFKNGEPSGYYQTTAVSYGLQAGAQKYGYVLFFMNHHALSYLHKSDGWEIGVGPSIVVVDEGVARSLSSTTLQKDIYAFIFDQKGLMAGLGLQGAKITPYYPDY